MKVQLNLRVFSDDREEFRKIEDQSDYKPAILFRKMLEAYKAQHGTGSGIERAG